MPFGDTITITYPDASTKVLNRQTWPSTDKPESEFKIFDPAGNGTLYEFTVRHSVQKSDGKSRHNVEYKVTEYSGDPAVSDTIHKSYAVITHDKTDVETKHSEAFAAFLDNSVVLDDLMADQA